jgi:hypothetical protein
MKLLISAYACAPNRGSEHGSAWNWITGLGRLGHPLWVLVSPAHRDAIHAAARQDSALKNIRWVFPELGYWKLQQGKEPTWERSYNLLWQRAALRAARALHAEMAFDAVHHLTWGGVRAPTFLGALGIPLIIGPVGGGETSPASLRDRFPPRGRMLEAVRDLSNATIEINPILRRGLRDAAVIFARTADTRNLLSPALRAKTLVAMELGVSPGQIGSPREPRQSPPKLLYAGRLLYWKGVHIAIEAMAALVEKIPGAHLTIVGYGPEEARLKACIAARKLTGNVELVSWMPQDRFLRLYDTHDMLLFPSLHDSTGWVVLEALCKGMPVACLDLGGPKDIVTAQSGLVIGTGGLNTGEVAARLAQSLHAVLTDPERLAALSAGAIARAHDFLLTDQITRLYDAAWQMIARGAGAWHDAAPSDPAASPPAYKSWQAAPPDDTQAGAWRTS